MRCLFPRTVGFKADGKTIAWSQKTRDRQYASFDLPCSKCIECRLEYARQWAIRCVHEAKMHEDNAFVTLTYSDENLKEPKLQYRDFQLFMKKLREKNPHKEIPMFVTGEYGEKTKRPHWHAIIFNWRPNDCLYKYSNERGDKVFSSKTLTELWKHGIAELGTVTFNSAGYVARYAAKKLTHGKDGHEWEPISKKSSKYAIGKTFLEKYWKDVFLQGHVILEGGQKCSIPRYYEKWLLKNKPEEWETYVTKIKFPQMEKASNRTKEEQKEYAELVAQRGDRIKRGNPIEKWKVKKQIINEKFKRLQTYLKGDI